MLIRMTSFGLRNFRCLRSKGGKRLSTHRTVGLLLLIASASFVVRYMFLPEAPEDPTSSLRASLIYGARENLSYQQDIDHAKRQQDRRQRIRDYCKNSTNNGDIFHQLPNRNHFNFVVSEKYKFIICYVPKTGASQWKRALINIIANRQVKADPDTISLFDHSLFTFLNRYPPKKRQEMLKSYTTFFFVREPFERLLSAYRDKFVTYTTSLYAKTGQEIVSKVRKSPKDGTDDDRNLPTFDEFTEYLDTLPDPSSWDMHWRPSHQTCYPCAIDYDYVGHFETVKEDADYILKQLNLDKIVEFPSFSGSRTPEHLKTHYSQIPLDRIIRLHERYRPDFDMFGYKYPDAIKGLFRA
ncbi:carbohydrate sulfotransferase 11-like isoform X2 [Montipora capricornis]|uniref:carbohydrate sulfotransferase 11-like isoform X2 n=1 Tax=Montipora capricornis TaxID=246305 RepID=UPI0035F12CA3